MPHIGAGYAARGASAIADASIPEFLAEAHHIVSLTEEGRKILLDRRGNERGPPIARRSPRSSRC
jgi:hypothetical protein